MRRVLVFLLLLCLGILYLRWYRSNDVFVSEELSKDDGTFVPTGEWQTIGRDQPIPKGLHVRINLQTGEREAKLLEVERNSDDEKKNSLVFVPSEGEAPADADNYKYEILKDALKNIKNEASVNQGEDESNDDQPKKKFRTYEQLKKELAGMQMAVKTDAEILNQLFKEFDEKYKKTGEVCSREDPELETFFENLENLLHQVDNAEEFSRRNGFREIIRPCLSSNSTSMRTLSARVLGAAVQNNPKVQIAALEAGVMTPLLKTINLERNYETRASSLFALSCLIRSFPFAETRLIEEGGLDVLLHLFDETSADLLKLQMKVVNLFYDLTLEKEDAEQSFKEQDNGTTDNEILLKEMQQTKDKLKQYKKVDLKTKLVERGWCTRLLAVLVATIPDTDFALVTDVQEGAVNHDIVDKISKAMMSFASECRQEFLHEDKFSKIEEKLLTYYKRLMSKDDVYKDIHETVQQLNKEMNAS